MTSNKTVFHRRQPMTEQEAIEGVSIMAKETPVAAQRALLRAALGPIGNLSEEAKEVYRQRLEEIS